MEKTINHYQKEEIKKAIWIKFDTNQLYLAQEALKMGFKLHHSKNNYLMTYLWLDKERTDNIPGYTTHMVGAGGIVIDNQERLLLLRENSGNRKDKWNIPMGRVDLGENFSQAAVREVQEEAGLETEFFDLLCFRELQAWYFEQPDLFFACLLKPTEKAIKELEQNNYQLNYDQHEISGFQWVPLNELKQFAEDPKNNVARPMQYYLLRYLNALYTDGYKFYKDKIFDFNRLKTKTGSNYEMYYPNLLANKEDLWKDIKQ
ncbi:NUDIX hydrolase domain protein [Pseudocohnilembus persalinus]|uniref:NUDIX hydrolase domain protein n=1 Tax=Pseudocohnilembus persalinus TaxID=266149 RepID=A0A0V0QN44_PSEPJ|nr:NUDIX hydrolase domain protein [Pseudocohnilembus persalinus]|eukprot:KRX03694.1 NUDIX hydrolase domain protein [Pseudocohnilembus persalinus]